jgi:hypothetical protein
MAQRCKVAKRRQMGLNRDQLGIPPTDGGISFYNPLQCNSRESCRYAKILWSAAARRSFPLRTATSHRLQIMVQSSPASRNPKRRPAAALHRRWRPPACSFRWRQKPRWVFALIQRPAVCCTRFMDVLARPFLRRLAPLPAPTGRTSAAAYLSYTGSRSSRPRVARAAARHRQSDGWARDWPL